MMDDDPTLQARGLQVLADPAENEPWVPETSAREIPRQGTSITGEVHHLHHCIGYESKLEWQCVQYLLFDPFSRLIISQPFKVESEDIVHFPDYLQARHCRLFPVLLEVKPLDVLVADWDKWEPKFRATDRLARDKRWEFRVVTSECLKRPRARNARFLLSYQLFSAAEDKAIVILETVGSSPGITVLALIERISGSIVDRPAWTSELYRLMATHEIWFDEDKLLDPETPLFPKRPYTPETIGYTFSELPDLVAEVRKQEAMKAQRDAEQRQNLRSTDVIFLVPGTKCNLDGHLVVFELLSSPGRAIVRREGEPVACDLAALRPLQHSLEEMKKAQANLDPEFLTYDEQQQAEAIRLRAGLEHLTARKNVPRAEVTAAAHALGIGATSAYKFLRRFRIRPVTSSFASVRKEREDAGTTKDPAIQPFFDEAIRDKYTGGQRGSVLAVARRLEELLLGSGLTMPSKETVRRWCNKIDRRIVIKTRSRTETETQILDHLHGTFKTDYPLAVVQLDTTWMDLHKVATHDRSQTVGRCYLTVAIDVYSRVVLGFFLSFNPPSGYNVGQCIKNSILPKNEWLALRGMADVSMPVFGLFNALHTDGGSENDNKLIRSIGREWNITTVIRPAKKVRYGAHIERLLGTVATRLKELLGAAFSSSEERGDYASERKAVYNMREAERELARIFWVEYLNEKHSALGMSPLEKLGEGMILRPGKLGGGALRVCGNPEKLKRDVLPFYEVTVQEYGIQLDYFRYFSPAIDHWRFNPHPSGGKFLARRDSILVNVLLFWCPRICDYIEVPLIRDTEPMDLTELRECTEFVRSMGWTPDTENIIRSRILRREAEDSAKAKTLKARRQEERKVQSAIARELEGTKMGSGSPSADNGAEFEPRKSKIDPSTVDLSDIEELE